MKVHDQLSLGDHSASQACLLSELLLIISGFSSDSVLSAAHRRPWQVLSSRRNFPPNETPRSGLLDQTWLRLERLPQLIAATSTLTRCSTLA